MRWITAGESHGKAISAIVEGIPAGLELSVEDINKDLSRRMLGHGRGGRMKIETDRVQILSGVRHGLTLGSPIQVMIENRDFSNWTDIMAVEKNSAAKQGKAIHRPRPGHADLAGMIKYNFDDARNVLERASARETAMRVAVGAIAKKFLSVFKIEIGSHVVTLGEISVPEEILSAKRSEKINDLADKSAVRCLSNDYSQKMVQFIDEIGSAGDTCGGIAEVVVKNLPVGLGSHVQWDRKLDGKIGAAMMSIPAVKGVEIGMGFDVAYKKGSDVHDEMRVKDHHIQRLSNNAGGLEGGITNGEFLIVRVAMKPISTLKKPLKSINLQTKKEEKAHFERSDITAVPACGVVAEAGIAAVLAEAFFEKFGRDNMSEIGTNYSQYEKYLADRTEMN